MAKPQEKMSFWRRLKELGKLFWLLAKNDRAFLPLVAVAVIVPLIAVAVLIAFGAGWLWAGVGVMMALLGVMIVLRLRVDKLTIKRAKEEPSGVAMLIDMMRGDWRVTPGVATTTMFDMVHVVVGRAGVILLGEGDPQRLRPLISEEKRRFAKIIGTADLRDFTVGDDEGSISHAKLRTTLMKLPRTITGKDVNALDKRVKAITARPRMPKGAIPKSMRPKGAPRTPRTPRGR